MALLLLPSAFASAENSSTEQAKSADVKTEEVKATEVKTDKKKVDMGDPTAVYSSFGAEYNSDNTLDMSVGIASGRHLLLVESKGGFDALSATYANMTQGSGFYAETTFNQDVRSLSAGYITTFKVGKVVTFYPVAMLGYNNNDALDFVTPTAIAGVYTRINVAPGWQLGLDPFVSAYGKDNEDGVFTTLSTDMFVGYQYEQHRFRLGYASSLVSSDKDDHSMFFNYKIAF